jgi:hypothetical protein
MSSTRRYSRRTFLTTAPAAIAGAVAFPSIIKASALGLGHCLLEAAERHYCGQVEDSPRRRGDRYALDLGCLVGRHPTHSVDADLGASPGVPNGNGDVNRAVRGWVGE